LAARVTIGFETPCEIDVFCAQQGFVEAATRLKCPAQKPKHAGRYAALDDIGRDCEQAEGYSG